MANCFKSGLSTFYAGARVVKSGAKFIGRNANKGISKVLDKTTNCLDKFAEKMEVPATKVKEEKVAEATKVEEVKETEVK